MVLIESPWVRKAAYSHEHSGWGGGGKLRQWKEDRTPSRYGDAVRYRPISSAASMLKHLWLRKAMEFNIPKPPSLSATTKQAFPHTTSLHPLLRTIFESIFPSAVRIRSTYKQNLKQVSAPVSLLPCKVALLSFEKHYPYVNNWIIYFIAIKPMLDDQKHDFGVLWFSYSFLSQLE
jgi:hypothetical protein